jgi:hypothetical protein
VLGSQVRLSPDLSFILLHSKITDFNAGLYAILSVKAVMYVSIEPGDPGLDLELETRGFDHISRIF